jgi:hypothetical protein
VPNPKYRVKAQRHDVWTSIPYPNLLAHLEGLSVKWEDNIKMDLTLKKAVLATFVSSVLIRWPQQISPFNIRYQIMGFI